MQDSLDERDAAYDAWYDWGDAGEPSKWTLYKNSTDSHQDDALQHQLMGWIGTGLGVALIATGVTLVFLAPDDGAPDASHVSIRPRLGPEGPGLELDFSW
jgi:hypothetical protein